jgi:hypothetical protein
MQKMEAISTKLLNRFIGHRRPPALINTGLFRVIDGCNVK